ncbi:TSUP family transporter [Streptomyces coeruleorubidus]
MALVVGVVGGIYGIGGGSILGPVLVGRGMPVARVAPAALASAFATSVAGAAAFALLSLTGSGDIAPDWHLGLACGLGGLVGGYLGACMRPRLPETALRLLLGVLATALGALYAVQSPCTPRAETPYGPGRRRPWWRTPAGCTPRRCGARRASRSSSPSTRSGTRKCAGC